MQKSRILIVEDSRTQAEALRALLTTEVEQVDVASSGEEAMRMLVDSDEPAPDLVLTDVVMPGMSGYDVTRGVKSDPRLSHVPVVLLTSLTDPLDIVRGLECGADNYVTKPYDPEYLLARLRHVLGQKRLRRDTRASLGVNVSFLGTNFTITSDREQILDLFISSVEDVVRTNHALQVSQRELAEAQQQLERYARQMAYRAHMSAEKYSVLMQHASDAIVVLDSENRIAEANARALEMLGRGFDDVREHPLTEFARPEDRAALARRIGAGESEDGAAESGDIYFLDRSGRQICCEVSVSQQASQENDLRLVILHDVTARRRAENEVRRTHELIRAVVEASPPAIVAADRDGRTMIWNPAAERLFGWSASEMVGRPLPMFLVDQHRALVSMSDLRDTEDAMPERETQFTRRDGTVVDARVASAALRDDSGALEGVLLMLEDITERKRTAAALAQSEEQLRQAQKMEAIGRLAGGVAHDFNNLLTAIRGYTHLVLSTISDTATRADLEEIDKAATRATTLTAQLLAFSRKQPTQARVLNLNAVVEGIEKMLRRLLAENISLRTELGSAAASVRADSSQIEQVLMNLVINAGDAMPKGGTITVRTSDVRLDTPGVHRHGVVPAGEYVELTVRDTGTGMDAGTLSHIFEPFFTTKGPGKGTGLGLSTVYGIVQQSGGHVIVESTPGSGSTFRVLLPHATGGQEVRHTGEFEVRATTGAERILLVEDETSVRDIAVKALRRAGYEVVEAADAAAGLEIFEGRPVDLVITDAVMPGMSGPELAALLAGRRPGMPILLMSGYSETSLADHGLDDEVELIGKPFTPAQLTKRVRELLDRR